MEALELYVEGICIVSAVWHLLIQPPAARLIVPSILLLEFLKGVKKKDIATIRNLQPIAIDIEKFIHAKFNIVRCPREEGASASHIV